MKATLLYTLARIGLFAVVFAVLRLTPLSVYLAAAVAAVIAMLVSYIFFGRLRRGVADTIVKRRVAPERDDDADAEDAALDTSQASTAAPSVAPAARRPSRQAPPAEDD